MHLDDDERVAIAARALGERDVASIALLERIGAYTWIASGARGVLIDERGAIRASGLDAGVMRTSVEERAAALEALLEATTRYGDIGRIAPALTLVTATRVCGFTGILERERLEALLDAECSGLAMGTALLLIAVPGDC